MDTLPPPLSFQPRRPIRYKPRASSPPAAPVLARVVGVSIDAERLVVTLTFDQPIVLAEDPPPPDDAIQFAVETPASIALAGAAALAFTMGAPLPEGAGWAVNRQPDWLLTPLVVPQSGPLD
jgi:hypothetical protein